MLDALVLYFRGRDAFLRVLSPSGQSGSVSAESPCLIGPRGRRPLRPTVSSYSRATPLYAAGHNTAATAATATATATVRPRHHRRRHRPPPPPPPGPRSVFCAGERGGVDRGGVVVRQSAERHDPLPRTVSALTSVWETPVSVGRCPGNRAPRDGDSPRD